MGETEEAGATGSQEFGLKQKGKDEFLFTSGEKTLKSYPTKPSIMTRRKSIFITILKIELLFFFFF